MLAIEFKILIMKKKSFKILSLILICLTFVNCSDDEYNFQVNQNSCRDTEVQMLIDGENYDWTTNTYGWEESPSDSDNITLFIRGIAENEEGLVRNITMRLPYKETGSDVIAHIEYSQTGNGEAFEGDSSEMNLESNVITNTANCFFTTFSTTVTDGNQEIIITNGSLSFDYPEPIPF